MKKINRIIASLLAVTTATVASGAFSLIANAYEASKGFAVGTAYETYYYAKAVGSLGGGSASAGTVLAEGQCGVTISYGSNSDSATGYGSAYTQRISGSGTAHSSHTASKGGYYGDTTMQFS